MDHKAFLEYRTQPDFIQKYIFPGGMLPSVEALDKPLKQLVCRLIFIRGMARTMPAPSGMESKIHQSMA